MATVHPDIVHFYHSHIMYSALRRLSYRPKVYEVVHNRFGFSGDSSAYPKTCTDCMVCVSDDAAAYCATKFPGFPTVVIPNGVDTDIFTPTKRVGHSTLVGGFSGRLEAGPGKGIPELIDIMKDMPCQFELVGQDMGGFRSQISSRKIGNIKVFHHSHKIEDFYDRWDFFVSRSPAEGFGLSIAEALACGLPAVVYNCGGVTKYLTHGKHALIANNDDEMRTYIRQVLANDHKLDPTSVDLSAKTMVSRYHEFYGKLLSKPFTAVRAEPSTKAMVRTATQSKTVVRAVVPTNFIDRLAVTTEDWYGVRRALAPITDAYSTPAGAMAALRDFRPKVVVFGCYTPTWEGVLKAARKQGCKTVLTWHASYVLNEFDHANREWLWHAHTAYKRGLFDFVTTPHKGLAETWTHFGIQTDYMPNLLDVDLRARTPLPGINIGILGSGQPWKNMDCQIIAANMVPGATVHIQKIRHAQAVDVVGCKYVVHPHIKDDAAYYDLVGGMTVNMVVSLSEVYSYLAAESLMMGVPVLTTAITPILRGTPELEELMTCNNFEDPKEMCRRLQILIKKKDELGEDCFKHVTAANARNKEIVNSVVERWMNAHK